MMSLIRWHWINTLEGTIRNRSRGLLHEPMMPSDDGTKKPYRKTCRA